ncbi:MAG: sulfotransferase, partial [Cyanobacteria bacterium J06641_5]
DRGLSYPELVDDFLRQRWCSAERPVIGATVHHHFDRLLKIWPDAKFVKILRDGRDVARSCIGMKWAGNLWRGADRWIEAEHLWIELARSLPPERYIEFKYEDLITDPAVVLGRICEFMGVAYDPAMLTYPQSTTYSTPDPKLVSQWKKKLSDRQIQLAEARIGTMLTERGYELSGLPRIEVSPLQVLVLHVHNYLMRTWGRLQDHGPLVVAMDFVSRRLGLKALNRYATLRINRSLETQLK